MNEQNSRSGRRNRRRRKPSAGGENKDNNDLDPAWDKYKDDLVQFATFMGKALGPIVDVSLNHHVQHGEGYDIVGEGGSSTASVVPTILDEQSGVAYLPPGIVKYPNEASVSNAWAKSLDSLLSEIRVLTARWVRKHPNITQLSQMAWKASMHPQGLVRPGLRLEEAPHGTLFDFLLPDKFSLKWRSKVLISRDVARALSFVHDCGVVHCDVKPENILLFPSKETERLGCPLAKISDFSHSVFECHHEDHLVKWRGCTVQWAAPEVKERNTQTVELIHLADIYSFGLLFWYILTDGEDIATLSDQSTSVADPEMAFAALSSITAEPKDLNISVASRILSLTLQRTPEDRATSMHVLLDILDKEILRYETTSGSTRLCSSNNQKQT